MWKRKILRVTESSLLQCEEKKGNFEKQQYVIMTCLNVTVISGDKKIMFLKSDNKNVF